MADFCANDPLVIILIHIKVKYATNTNTACQTVEPTRKINKSLHKKTMLCKVPRTQNVCCITVYKLLKERRVRQVLLHFECPSGLFISHA